ncbi:phosphoribosylglycinamide formyltransferase [Nosocomiicoccus sp. HMSC059G07]|uniref:phosphoribosylglycinamide formyltransferase n=1 Tax=Nosocomiicoccus sp. HMSC059G07 TaxID=1739531 RepID=UPI001FEF468F|nr:phosphoribosylglycinamide formyltransferase [Nosocomiicoccus sp. HMSC059G07]
MKKDLQSMVNVAVFASGSGSNFENIATSDLPLSIKVLIVDNKDAKAIERAKRLNVPYEIVERSGKTKEEFEAEILNILKDKNIEYILLAGFMKILSAEFIERYDRKIINIHPSLLPSFKGKNGILDAYNYGVKVSGVTVHYVDSGIDTGEIIDQEPVVLRDDDTLESFEEKIHKAEYKLYIRALKKVLEVKE